MATFRILVLVSKTEIRSREFSISSRSLRMLIINLNLVSMLEIVGHFFSVSSRSMRLSVRNSHSRLEIEKMTLADLCSMVTSYQGSHKLGYLRVFVVNILNVGDHQFISYRALYSMVAGYLGSSVPPEAASRS